jgi:hypothetical protein
VQPSLFFVDALVGGERRIRVANPTEDKLTEYSQGAGLIGLKLGVAKRFESNWEVAGTIGTGIMFVIPYDVVNESSVFVEAEVNRYFRNNWFVGTGWSWWDLTRDRSRTNAWPLRFGIPVNHSERHPIFAVGEGRWYLDHSTHLGTHYQAWGGLRIHFGK